MPSSLPGPGSGHLGVLRPLRVKWALATADLSSGVHLPPLHLPFCFCSSIPQARSPALREVFPRDPELPFLPFLLFPLFPSRSRTGLYGSRHCQAQAVFLGSPPGCLLVRPSLGTFHQGLSLSLWWGTDSTNALCGEAVLRLLSLGARVGKDATRVESPRESQRHRWRPQRAETS